MPDENRTLTDTEIQELEAWMTDHGVDMMTCPACARQKRPLEVDLVGLEKITVENGAMKRLDHGLSMVTVTCPSCAHTMMFNARAVGIV